MLPTRNDEGWRQTRYVWWAMWRSSPEHGRRTLRDMEASAARARDTLPVPFAQARLALSPSALPARIMSNNRRRFLATAGGRRSSREDGAFFHRVVESSEGKVGHLGFTGRISRAFSASHTEQEIATYGRLLQEG